MALDQQYRKMLRDLMLQSDSLAGQQTLPDGSIIGYGANNPDAMVAAVAPPPPPQVNQQPQTPQQLSALLVNQRPQGFNDQQRFDEAYQFKQSMPEKQSYLRNNTTGAVQMLPSFVRQPAMQQQPQEPSPKQIIDDLMYYAKGKSIPSDQLGKMIQYQATKAQGAPSAQDLYHEASGRGIPIETLISAYLTIGGANTAREKENLALQKQRAELAQLQAKPTSALDAARAKVLADVEGERLKAQIPGTAENERVQKRDAGEKKEQSAWSNSIKQSDTMNDYIDRVLGTGNYEGKGSKLGYFATGLPGQVLENFGSTDARNLRGDLDRIKANIGFEELNKMRRESPTGGALGQVTERELQFLQSVQGALDQAQSPDQLERMLWDIKNSTMRLKQDLKANPPKGFSGSSAGTQRAPVSGAESQAMLMQEAQAAIAAGAPREAVMQRLQERMGR